MVDRCPECQSDFAYTLRDQSGNAAVKCKEGNHYFDVVDRGTDETGKRWYDIIGRTNAEAWGDEP